MKKIKLTPAILSFVFTVLIVITEPGTCHAWSDNVHRGIVRDALYYMQNSPEATARQKETANWINANWGTTQNKPSDIIAQGVVDIDYLDNLCFDNDEIWPFNEHYTAYSGVFGDHNYTSYMHFFDLPSKENNWPHPGHANQKGGVHNNIDGYNYFRHNNNLTSWGVADIDDAVELWMGNDDFCIQHSGILLDWYEEQQGGKDDSGTAISSSRHSCYTRWEQDHCSLIYAPIDNLARYWADVSVRNWHHPENGPYYLGYALHAAGDASQIHHVRNSIGWGHAEFEDWADHWYSSYSGTWFDFAGVKDAIDNVFTEGGMLPCKRDISWLLETLAGEANDYYNQTKNDPSKNVWNRKPGKTQPDNASNEYMQNLYPKAVACAVIMIDKCYQQAGVSPPDLSYPDNGAVGLPDNLTLNWEDSCATAYHVQVATDSEFNNIVTERSNLQGNSLQVNLDYGTCYYWRAGAVYSGGVIWSEVRSFTTMIGIPSLVNPADGQKGLNNQFNLVWSYPSNSVPVRYLVQISKDGSGFTGPNIMEFRNQLTQLEVFTGVDLEAATQHWWRVKAYNDSIGESDWSETGTFSTGVVKPALISPTDWEKGASLKPTLKWEASSRATGYTVEIYEIPSGSLVKSELTQNNYYEADLSPGAYSWRVRAHSAAYGDSEWSDIWAFETEIPPTGPPVVPVLSSPANFSQDIHPAAVTLSWMDCTRASSYKLEISRFFDFRSTVYHPVSITQSSWTVPGVLDNNTYYYWRVKACNSEGESDWSQSWSFKAGTVVPLPDRPVLLSPLNGARVPLKGLTLKWNNAARASHYTVEVCSDRHYDNDLVFKQSGISDTYIVITKDLPAKKQYWWRVKAYNAGGESAWSADWSFTMER